MLMESEEAKAGLFGLGKPNDGFARYFVGQSYLNPVVTQGLGIYNVTFSPGCRNNWHIHHAAKGGGQILLCMSGRGWYQEWEQEAQLLLPGQAVSIPPEVKHWHGAASDSWFAHLAIEVPGEKTSTEWCEEVSKKLYESLH